MRAAARGSWAPRSGVGSSLHRQAGMSGNVWDKAEEINKEERGARSARRYCRMPNAWLRVRVEYRRHRRHSQADQQILRASGAMHVMRHDVTI